MTTFASQSRTAHPEVSLPAGSPEGPVAPPGDQASRLRQLIADLAHPVTRPAFAPVSASRIGPGNGSDPAVESASRVERAVRSAAALPVHSVPIIAIGSGKGGVGKTSTAVNLSVAFAALGLRATLVDADLGMANADVMCGIVPGRRLDQAVAASRLSSDDFGTRTLSQIAIKAPGGFMLVPGAAGVARMADLTETERLTLLDQFSALETQSDVLVVDTGAGLSPGVTTFLHAADLTLVLATPEPTSIADAYALIKCLRAGAMLGRRGRTEARIALVVSQARDEQEASAVHSRIDAVCRRFLKTPLAFAGWIRADASVGDAVRRRTPLLVSSPTGPAAGDLRRLALHLAGTLSLPVRCAEQEPSNGFLARLRRVFHISTST